MGGTKWGWLCRVPRVRKGSRNGRQCAELLGVHAEPWAPVPVAPQPRQPGSGSQLHPFAASLGRPLSSLLRLDPRPSQKHDGGRERRVDG